LTPNVAVLLDLDGTLVDANYQHALAWFRALRSRGIVVPIWRIHRHIGMGGDELISAVAGEETERRYGNELREAEHEEFLLMRDECEPLEGARELLDELHDRASAVVLASSASEDDVEYFLGVLGAQDLIDGWTTSDDVERAKPHPDIVQAALEKATNRDRAVMIGDSRWDIEAAARAGLQTLCVLTGGWSKQELEASGASCVFESLVELRRRIDETPIADGP
jgi:HAD superfamily hydrolase (TIGR01549 family)